MDLFTPTVGQIYRNHNGYDYECTAVYSRERAAMRRVKDGWTLVAVGIRQHPDSTIEWDYSLGGCWTKESGGEQKMKKYFDYLDDLRDSGTTNMFGAVPYLQQRFPELSSDHAQAVHIFQEWMNSYQESEGEAKC